MNSTLQFLGTGSSLGTPLVGCSCAVCTSSSSFNKRMRPSALITSPVGRILIDAGPDFRNQALRFGIRDLDAIILTHAHHDHTGGMDDLRAIWYKRKEPIPIFLSAETASELCVRFAYLFGPMNDKFKLHLFSKQEGIENFKSLSFGYTTYSQGSMKVNGLRFGSLAYISDIHTFPPTLLPWLKGVETLVLSALRQTGSPLHFSIDEAVDFGRATQAKTVWLTHIAHDVDYEKTNAYLPSNIQLAYDGLILTYI